MRDVTLNDIPDYEEGKYLILVDYYDNVYASNYWEKEDQSLVECVMLMNYTTEEFDYVRTSGIKRVWLVNDKEGKVV